jgi:hypothetical protein
VKRKNRDYSSREYGSGQINAYPPAAAGNPAAVAGMMTLAEELLTKKGLSLKDLQVHICCAALQLGLAQMLASCWAVLDSGEQGLTLCCSSWLQ